MKEPQDMRSGVRIPVRARDCFLLQNPRPAMENTQRPIQWIPGLFPEGKAVGA